MKEYKKILEDLYNGRIKPSQDEIKSEEYARIRKEGIVDLDLIFRQHILE